MPVRRGKPPQVREKTTDRLAEASALTGIPMPVKRKPRAAEPTPAPVATPTPAPVATPAPAPVATPTPAPVATPTPAPVNTPVAESSPTPAPQPLATPAPAYSGIPEPGRELTSNGVPVQPADPVVVPVQTTVQEPATMPAPVWEPETTAFTPSPASTAVITPASVDTQPPVPTEVAAPVPATAAEPALAAATTAAEPALAAATIAAAPDQALASSPASSGKKGEDKSVEQAGCATCGGFHSGLQGPMYNATFSSCADGACVPGRPPCDAPALGCGTLLGGFCSNIYQMICCPDPCYQPVWDPAANASFFVDYARPRTVTRFRYDNLSGMIFPDRNQYFFKQIHSGGAFGVS